MTGPQTNEERVTSEAVALVDRADRVKDLLEFLAGYTLLVDACEDGATVDQLNMGLPRHSVTGGAGGRARVVGCRE